MGDQRHIWFPGQLRLGPHGKGPVDTDERVTSAHAWRNMDVAIYCCMFARCVGKYLPKKILSPTAWMLTQP